MGLRQSKVVRPSQAHLLVTPNPTSPWMHCFLQTCKGDERAYVMPLQDVRAVCADPRKSRILFEDVADVLVDPGEYSEVESDALESLLRKTVPSPPLCVYWSSASSSSSSSSTVSEGGRTARAHSFS